MSCLINTATCVHTSTYYVDQFLSRNSARTNLDADFKKADLAGAYCNDVKTFRKRKLFDHKFPYFSAMNRSPILKY
jgi:hypothetical protein